LTASSETGPEGFRAGIQRCGAKPRIEESVVTFEVTPLDGSLVGTRTRAGVGIDELSSWPAVPPHWVHLPADVAFARSNTRPSSVSNWVMHSREIRGWGNAADPAQAWIAHVRAVLGDAI
jgi:hypothetical protein